MSENMTGKRQVVVVVRERNGSSLPAVFKSEGAALGWIKARVAKGTTLNADEANSWNDLHSRFEMKRINHQEAYSLDGACTNWAESYFSRLRRAEAGHHHHIAGAYLLRYAQEASWREDNRRAANGEQVRTVAHLALNAKPSKAFAGYWQRHCSMNDLGNRYALAALKRQRGTLAGEIVTLKKRLAWAESQLIHVDATLHLLDPATDATTLPTIRPQKRIKLFRQGELSQTVRDVLRRAGKPLQTQEVVTAVLAAGGLGESARPALAPRVRGNLAYLETSKKVVKTGKGRGVLWALLP
jgi:hypothetical protein